MQISNRQKTQRPIPSMGPHVARCYALIDLGTQSESFNGQTKFLRKIQLGWELPNQTAVFDPQKGPQPMTIFKNYTASLGDKSNLGQTIKSWLNMPKIDEFDLKNLIGKECMINITHNYSKNVELPIAESINKDGRIVYANIANLMPLMPGTPIPNMVNNALYFSFDNFSWASFHALPQWIQKEIRNSQEFPGISSVYGPEPQDSSTANNGGGYQQQGQSQYQQPQQVPQYQQPQQQFQQPVQQQFQQPVQQQQFQQPQQQQFQQAPPQQFQQQAPAYMPPAPQQAPTDPFANDGGAPPF